MQEDYLSKIRSVYNQFTKAEKKVADYILMNPKKVLFMSISDLAEACEVGDTSVFRFCKTMNVKGYQEFKMLLSLSMRATGGEGQSFCVERDISLDDDLAELTKKVLATNISALQETWSLIDQEQLSSAITTLHEAKRILFFGVGASMLTAMKAMNKFLRIEPKSYCVQDAHMQAMLAANMTSEDVAVLFSYSGATKALVNIAELAKQAGASTIAITRFVKSPLTEYADQVFLCGANEGPLQGGSTSAELSQMFLVDVMYCEYYRRYHLECEPNHARSTAAVSGRIL